MNAFDRTIANLRSEIRANPLLGLGIAAIGILLALYLYSAIGNWKDSLQQQLEHRLHERARIASIAGEQDWRNRAAQARRALAAARAHIPTSESQGLAQATYQAWLRGQVMPFAPGARIDVSAPTPVEGEKGLWKIDATVSAAVQPAAVLQILNRLQQSEQLTNVTTLRVVSSPPGMQLQVATYYLIGGKR